MAEGVDRLREWLIQEDADERFLREMARRARPGVASDLEILADRRAARAKILRLKIQKVTLPPPLPDIAVANDDDDTGDAA